MTHGSKKKSREIGKSLNWLKIKTKDFKMCDLLFWHIKGTFITSHLREEGEPRVSDLSLHLRKPEKEEQMKPKFTRRMDIIKIRTEDSKIENRSV